MGGLRMRVGLGVLLFSALGACGGRAANDSEETGGANAGDTGAIAEGCTQYCAAQKRKVCEFASDDQCPTDCSKELGRQTLDCRKIAALMLDCLVDAYERGSDCDSAERFAREQCATSIAAYQGCAEPLPGPAVEPPPRPPDCTRSGSVGSLSCSESMACGNGARYEVRCTSKSAKSSSCSCNSGAPFDFDMSVEGACSFAISNCPVAE